MGKMERKTILDAIIQEGSVVSIHKTWLKAACGRSKFIQSVTETIRLLGGLEKNLFWSLDFRKRRSEDLFWRRGLGNWQWSSIVRDILPTKEVGEKSWERIVGNARAKGSVLVMG
jgi:hypothetical protein